MLAMTVIQTILKMFPVRNIRFCESRFKVLPPLVIHIRMKNDLCSMSNNNS